MPVESPIGRDLRIQQARRTFFERGEVPQGLSDYLVASWMRCRSFGIDPGLRPEFDSIGAQRLARSMEQSRALVRAADPVLSSLREQTGHEPSLIILTDADGVVLRSVGERDFAALARKRHVRAGVPWTEECKGTNAMGTALSEGKPVIVHGPEHYLAANQIFTCTAAPICGPDGEVIGTLDVTGDARIMPPYPLPFVGMAAELIENYLLQQAFPGHVLLRFHPQPEYLGTLAEGLAVISPEGTCVAVNRRAMRLLRLNGAQARHRPIEALLDVGLAQLCDRARGALQAVVQLHGHDGSRLFARVEGMAARPPAQSSSSEEKPRVRAAAPRLALDELEAGDPVVRGAVAQARQALRRGLNVLIQGETGSGKEVLARALHAESEWRRGPFVPVNCAAIPEGLIESELFGYEEGAFTGARRRGHKGKIREADGGTLFLDEIGDMPLALQARLLRVIEERSVQPLGGGASDAVEFMLISASHRVLRDMVASGAFRADLYYRLNGVNIRLPALRERADLERLLERVLKDVCAPGQPPGLAAEVRELFLRHPWPGNLRELRNVLSAAVGGADGEDAIVRLEHLPADFLDEAGACPQRPAAGSTESLEHVEMEAIRRAIAAENGNMSAAARRLGVARTTLYRRLKDT